MTYTKTHLLFIIFSILFTVHTKAQVLNKLEIGFQDSQSIKGKTIYKELIDINDDNLPFKPMKLDITLILQGNIKSSADRIEILIEEFYEPTNLNNGKHCIENATWVPHKVIITTNKKFIKNNKLTLKDVDYKTAGFSDSLLYSKLGFRIVALYYNLEKKELQRIQKEYIYSE